QPARRFRAARLAPAGPVRDVQDVPPGRQDLDRLERSALRAPGFPPPRLSRRTVRGEEIGPSSARSPEATAHRSAPGSRGWESGDGPEFFLQSHRTIPVT